MNTTELVRFDERAYSRPPRPSSRGPQFYSELVGPVRRAILRGRQFLLHEQRADGYWQGNSTSDAALASQFILSCAYFGEEDTQLAQQAAAAVLELQLPNGGWSRTPDGAADVSTSVLAYFALKLTGMDASDERLVSARQVIRGLGGADAADWTTRYFLAMLGQVSYECCAVLPPESLRRGHRDLLAPLAIIWCHRPVREIEVQRGVRELFVTMPREWPRHSAGVVITRFGNGLPSRIGDRVIRLCERLGWTPFRGPAIDRTEARVLTNIQPACIEQLDFEALLWHRIALHTLGFASDGDELLTCEAQLRDLIVVDDDQQRATACLRTEPVRDTLTALRSLSASGLAAGHPSYAAAMKSPRRRQARPNLSTLELLDLVRLVPAVEATREASGLDALPPSIEMGGGRWSGGGNTRRVERRLNRMRSVAKVAVRELLQRQKPDGGWSSGPGRESDIVATGQVLEVIAPCRLEPALNALKSAIGVLLKRQHADGRWEDAGGGAIQATAGAICGLVAAGVPPESSAIAAGANWLVVHQNADGGWGEHCHSTSPTAWALRALTAAGLANYAAARRAVDFLVQSQQDDGRWCESVLVLNDTTTGRWFRNAVQTAAAPLLALSQWAVAASAEESCGATQFELRLVGASAEA